MKKRILIAVLAVTATSCYNVECNCKDFKTGKFQFEYEVDGVKKISDFVRNDTLEVGTFEGKEYSSTVRWVSDCEYILQRINPKNIAESKAIQMNILSTTENSYTFEFSNIGESKKQKGTVTKINN